MGEAETVTMAVGDGGAITRRFIRDEILSRFPGEHLRELEDAAHLPLGGATVAVTTDSYTVTPPIFPGGDIGRLAVSGTVNDLVASGAAPRFMTLSLIASEGFPMRSLRRILDSAASTAVAAGVEVVAGDTKVVSAAALGVCLNTTGVGSPLRPGRRYSLREAQAGDEVIITGHVGDHALAVLSQREGLGFERRVESDCAPLNDLILPVIRKLDGVRAMRDPTRGGLAGALHDLAEASGCDVWFDAGRVLVRPEVNFACEMLGLDPFDLVNEGKMLIVAAPEQSADVLAMLREHPLGRSAALIGHVEPPRGAARRVVCATEDGERLLTHREKDQPPRLC
jgi:hydrogenase expression/formation protein HypE